jgi:hypothetical protein
MRNIKCPLVILLLEEKLSYEELQNNPLLNRLSQNYTSDIPDSTAKSEKVEVPSGTSDKK